MSLIHIVLCSPLCLPVYFPVYFFLTSTHRWACPAPPPHAAGPPRSGTWRRVLSPHSARGGHPTQPRLLRVAFFVTRGRLTYSWVLTSPDSRAAGLWRGPGLRPIQHTPSCLGYVVTAHMHWRRCPMGPVRAPQVRAPGVITPGVRVTAHVFW